MTEQHGRWRIEPLAPAHFAGVVALGNLVHGDGYLTDEGLRAHAAKSFHNGINCSFVALEGDTVVGFRLTFAAGHWQPDQWCTPDKWPVSPDKVCYFKCNTVDEAHRGEGLGAALLRRSIDAARAQGAEAGLAHIWRASPGNSAFLYFSKCGGQLVADHPGKWRQDSLEGYDCVICGIPCSCTAAEMIIDFRTAPGA
ncbi:GNAT family N-acetyltransferase [Ferrimonas balearica]|uniref:GNAT family N-acetyltransferase n=1 Tax=Ferrimonas balearica TaxID=44012 RepID=UPI001C992549|nr:GNAT family N-acetyltransferase [Ferrimonas balearica]MBY5992231.1 GNAT family N-acetyltransferase [Ferrimonas balearica]